MFGKRSDTPQGNTAAAKPVETPKPAETSTTAAPAVGDVLYANYRY